MQKSAVVGPAMKKNLLPAWPWQLRCGVLLFATALMWAHLRHLDVTRQSCFPFAAAKLKPRTACTMFAAQLAAAAVLPASPAHATFAAAMRALHKPTGGKNFSMKFTVVM
ncbi:hypothetical protein GUJ93_ZPchr0006g45673 [Zizania palustris]|uniref:Uncharacterized protein n=1 Tax=Zizania palustris TaxID=103762 RepID=A0A8J5VM87_ZIZPA|nr:hypothetical protein GUJ93_ZPchr0006g45673 [Zizania palustris]